jgi:hypothetical protein
MKRVFAGESFRNQAEIIARCRQIRDRGQAGNPITGQDHEFLLSLLRDGEHRHAVEKVGCGVASFSVRKNQHNTYGFWLRRVDGSETDFSFYDCVERKSPESRHRQDVVSALRALVGPQVSAFRASAFRNRVTVDCAVSGLPVTFDVCHVDHDPPFDALVDGFMRSRGLTFAAIAVVPTADGQTVNVIADQRIAHSWTEYHANHARLQILSAEANLSKSNRRGAVVPRGGAANG